MCVTVKSDADKNILYFNCCFFFFSFLFSIARYTYNVFVRTKSHLKETHARVKRNIFPKYFFFSFTSYFILHSTEANCYQCLHIVKDLKKSAWARLFSLCALSRQTRVYGIKTPPTLWYIDYIAVATTLLSVFLSLSHSAVEFIRAAFACDAWVELVRGAYSTRYVPSLRITFARLNTHASNFVQSSVVFVLSFELVFVWVGLFSVHIGKVETEL